MVNNEKPWYHRQTFAGAVSCALSEMNDTVVSVKRDKKIGFYWPHFTVFEGMKTERTFCSDVVYSGCSECLPWILTYERGVLESSN